MSQRTSAYAFLWDYHTRCKHEGSIPHDDLRADAFASLSTISKLKLYSRTQRDGLNDLKATASACPPSFQPWNNKQHICFVDPLEVSPILSKKRPSKDKQVISTTKGTNGMMQAEERILPAEWQIIHQIAEKSLSCAKISVKGGYAPSKKNLSYRQGISVCIFQTTNPNLSGQ